MDARTFAMQYIIIMTDKKVGKLAGVPYDLRKPTVSRGHGIPKLRLSIKGGMGGDMTLIFTP
jgi:hypothetical protein